jgi:hypothetical protein
MKRVVAFFDMFDEIPDNAKYLYSKKMEVPVAEKENVVLETEGAIVSLPAKELVAEPSTSLYIHYYEVDGMDFEDLIREADFVKKQAVDKIKEFMQRYKVHVK